MNSLLGTAAGVGVGLFVAPKVLNALNIPSEQGFGMDDVVTIATVIASLMLVKRFIH